MPVDNLTASWSRLAGIVAWMNNRVGLFTGPTWTSNRLHRVVTPRQP